MLGSCYVPYNTNPLWRCQIASEHNLSKIVQHLLPIHIPLAIPYPIMLHCPIILTLYIKLEVDRLQDVSVCDALNTSTKGTELPSLHSSLRFSSAATMCLPTHIVPTAPCKSNFSSPSSNTFYRQSTVLLLTIQHTYRQQQHRSLL